MVGPPTKALVPACTLSVQFCRWEPLDIVQLRVAGEEPDTETRSGLLAWKLIVPGVADTVPKVPKASLILDALNGPAR